MTLEFWQNINMLKIETEGRLMANFWKHAGTWLI